MEKPYADWTDRQRQWFDREYLRSRLPAPDAKDERLIDPSSRGRKRSPEHDALYHEQQLAKLSGKVITYRDMAKKHSKYALIDPTETNENGTIAGAGFRRRMIVACQRRRRIFSDPPEK